MGQKKTLIQNFQRLRPEFDDAMQQFTTAMQAINDAETLRLGDRTRPGDFRDEIRHIRTVVEPIVDTLEPLFARLDENIRGLAKYIKDNDTLFTHVSKKSQRATADAWKREAEEYRQALARLIQELAVQKSTPLAAEREVRGRLVGLYEPYVD